LPGFIIEFNKTKKITSGKTSGMVSGMVSGKTSGKTSEKILQLISQNQEITIPELARIFKISERSVERNLSRLQKNQKLKRVGGAKGGKWQIVA
jgi:ATP-dependent DNA helicase RecG